MKHPMEDSITDGPSDPEDRPEHEDEEVRDATTVDFISEELLKTIMDIGGVYRPGFIWLAHAAEKRRNWRNS